MNQKKGFIALMSVIIITFVLLLLGISLGFTGFFGRLNIFDSELKVRSNALAEACIEVAILKIAEDPAYSQGSISVIPVDAESCYIFSVDNSGGKAEVFTGGVAGIGGKAYSCYRSVVDVSIFEIIEFEELLTGDTCAFP